MAGFADDAEGARIAFGTQWNRRVQSGYASLDRLINLKTVLLAMRQTIIDNTNGKFIVPDDLNNADADLQALKAAVTDFANSL